MITGAFKGKIDRIWDAFWSGTIPNTLQVIKQISYLPFIRRLDDLHTAAENKTRRIEKPSERRVLQDDLRWARFKDLEPGVRHKVAAKRQHEIADMALNRQHDLALAIQQRASQAQCLT